MYAENYKTLLSQRIEYKCSWIEKSNILKMSIHQVYMYIKYNASQNPSEFFSRDSQDYYMIYMERHSFLSLDKEECSGRNTSP